MPDDISLVLPTHDRAGALRANLPRLLELHDVDEVVVVDDGSRDETPELLGAASDPRLRVVRHPRRRGAPAARNAGASAASGTWLLFVEDDCRFPEDFATILRAEAHGHGADVVSAPMVHVAGHAGLSEALAEAREHPRPPDLDSATGFPPEPSVTPMLQAPSLVRAAVHARLGFDEGYRGNGYREETDFFVRACRAGFKCLLTPATFFWEEDRYDGGQPGGRLATTYWTLRNNWRFLRRHGEWLHAHGLIDSRWRAQMRLLGRRLHAGGV